MVKYCKYCNTEKDISNFRERYDKRLDLKYYNNSCRSCDALYARQYYNARKTDPEFMKKNVQHAEKYRKKNWCIVKEKLKASRQTEVYKSNRKRYIEEHKGKIRSQEKICKTKYANYHKDNLTDNYIVQKLCGKHYGSLRNDFKEQKDLIEAKRAQLKIIRFLNQ